MLRYSIDERPPHLLAAGLGLQIVTLIIAGIVLTPTIVMRAAGQADSVIQWAIFAGLVVCGITTMLQARPLGRLGAGYVLFMGTSGAFIAISIEAVEGGGLPLLASLVIGSSLLQFLFSHNLGRLRNIVTPTVGGTVIMLIAVTVFPIAFDMLDADPTGAPEGSIVGPVIATGSFVTILAISLFAKGAVRLWGPLVGVLFGSLLAYFLGALDLAPVAAAAWVGTPDAGWPGLDLSFEVDYWLLLVPFSIVTIVGAIETYGDGVAIQRLSHREQRPIDFRAVQGAVNADGVGNLLSGVLGTLPNTTYSTSLSVVDLTGVASRSVGLYGGAFLVLIAFCPKVAGLLMAVPEPVAGAYITILLILLFLHGLRMAAEEGLDFERGMVVCVSFWLATGFQKQTVFHDHLPEWSRGLLDNGMTSGGIIALTLTALLRFRNRGARHVDLPAEVAAIPAVQALAVEAAHGASWDREAKMRLELAAEEAVLSLLESQGGGRSDRRLRVRATVEGHDQVRLEFVSGAPGQNLESALAEVERGAEPREHEAGLRILGNLAESVRHQQFHDVEVLILTVASKPL